MNVQISNNGIDSSIDTKQGNVTERTVQTQSAPIKWQETEDSVTLEIPMPNAEAKSLDVALSGRQLTVKYEKSEEKRTTENGIEKVVQTSEKIRKEVDLPVDVEPTADANLKAGILIVKLRKAKPSPGGRGERVEVKAG